MSGYSYEPTPWRTLARFMLRLSRPERGLMIGLIVSSVLLSVLEGGGITLCLLTLYRLVAPDSLSGDFKGEPLLDYVGHLSTPTLLVAAAITVIVAAALRALVMVVSSLVANRVTHRARRGVYGGYVESSYEHASRHGHGAMLDTLDYEIPLLTEAVLDANGILSSSCAALVYMSYLFLLSPQLCLVAVAIGLVLAALLMLAARPLERIGGRVSQLNERLLAHTMSTVAALRTVRLHAAERDFSARYGAASARVARAQVKVVLARGVVSTLRQFAKLAALATLLWSAFALEVPAAITIMVFALLVRLLPYITDAEERLMALFNRRLPLSIVYRAMDRDNIPLPSPGHLPFAGLTREIRLEGVRFEHEPGQPVLNGVDCTIPAGALVTLIGPSGGGKTTLINLLARLYEPQQGRILVDGVSLPDIARESWLSRLAFSGQDLDLQDGTILENIRFFDPDISEADVMWAAGVAHIDDFIATLPQGLHTPVGDRGLRLSGGQRQRLGLARAIARRPQFLILDEATNAVDIALEARILAAVRAALPAATILIVTHRTAIQGADHELMLANGEIRPVERKPPA